MFENFAMGLLMREHGWGSALHEEHRNILRYHDPDGTNGRRNVFGVWRRENR